MSDTKTDEITALLTGASSSAGVHDRWLKANIGDATFMGLSINGGVCRAITAKLKAVETTLRGFTAQSLGIKTVSGFQSGGYKSYHSWGLAIDINYVTNPYVMHEAGERTLDQRMKPVFDRIARFLIFRETDHPTKDSIIPDLGGRQTDVSKVYKALKIENEAMKRYFALMKDGTELVKYLATEDGKTGYQRAFAGSRDAPSDPDSGFVQRQMEQDWTVLTSTNPMPTINLAPSKAVPHPDHFEGAPKLENDTIDRPFDGKDAKRKPIRLEGRSPLSGYMDLSSDLVNALVKIGFVWGAVGFGDASGDIMHFDARKLTDLKFADGKSIRDLNNAKASWDSAHTKKKA